MRWIRWLRVRLLLATPANAQKRVEVLDHALAVLRAEVAALPAHERAARAPDIQALLAEHARARNVLSDALDDRAAR